MIKQHKDQQFNRTEKTTLTISAVIILLCLLLLNDHELMQKFLPFKYTTNQQPEIGRFISAQGDVRYKSHSSFDWLQTSANKNIHIGDSVFSGDNSNVLLSLGDKNQITMGANSLIKFRKSRSGDIADLTEGNFELEVNGNLKVAISGVEYDLNGQNSKIQIFFDKNKKPQFRVNQGNVNYSAAAKKLALNEVEKTVDYPPFSMPEKLNPYFWKLADLYTTQDANEYYPIATPTFPQKLTLNWRDQQPTKYIVQIATDAEFRQLFSSYEVFNETSLSDLQLPLGHYYWRVRRANEPQNWSDINHLHRTASLKPEIFKTSFTTGELIWQPTQNLNPTGYIIEYKAPQWSMTRSYRVSSPAFKFLNHQEGVHRWRVRSFNENLELSEWSKEQKYNHALPRLAVKKTLPQKTKPAEKQVIAEKPVEPVRKPTSVQTTTTRIEPPPVKFNEFYDRSRFQFEGASFGMFSSQQAVDEQPIPYATLVTVRHQHWFNSFGLDNSLKTKLFNYNGAGEDVSPTTFESRVMHRFFIGTPWTEFLRQVQVSSIFAVEIYKNKKSDYFNSGYNMFKLGLGLDFPLASRWDSSGDILYGRSTDSSWKLELSGRINYFYTKKWTIGAGYRMHLFEAGSINSAPFALPYRESYLEAYSVLRYLYE